MPDVWKGIPATVLALLAFGLRRMAMRFLGVFQTLEALREGLKEHVEHNEEAWKRNEEAHLSINKSIEKIDNTVRDQSRRVDDLLIRERDRKN